MWKLGALLLIAYVANAQSNPCEQLVEAGDCKGYFIRYFFDQETQKCKRFAYGGCGGNDNKFITMDECKRNCEPKEVAAPTAFEVCNMRPETGHCKAYIPRYYFDSETKTCKQFVYGGCGGNQNSFDNELNCRSFCQVIPSNEEVCALEAETGPCRASMPRYFFNSATGTCEKFTYGGCLGNENNFQNEEDCHKICNAPVKAPKLELCSLRAESGPCRAYIPRYFYNSETEKCEKFVYGGCRGNANNFKNEEDCHQICSEVPAQAPKLELCSLRAETGPCRAYIPMYYFDTETNTCKSFVYGGCQGNENRFPTIEQCHNTCLE